MRKGVVRLYIHQQQRTYIRQQTKVIIKWHSEATPIQLTALHPLSNFLYRSTTDVNLQSVYTLCLLFVQWSVLAPEAAEVSVINFIPPLFEKGGPSKKRFFAESLVLEGMVDLITFTFGPWTPPTVWQSQPQKVVELPL